MLAKSRDQTLKNILFQNIIPCFLTLTGVHDWFLEITFVHDVCILAFMRVCVCPPPRLLITSGMIWCFL